uniref:CNH domain-containing protein n=1 Tax=Steinernema glaseri TaxID=37863 RepID=A0A1I7YSI6_9BILA
MGSAPICTLIHTFTVFINIHDLREEEEAVWTAKRGQLQSSFLEAEISNSSEAYLLISGEPKGHVILAPRSEHRINRTLSPSATKLNPKPIKTANALLHESQENSLDVVLRDKCEVLAEYSRDMVALWFTGKHILYFQYIQGVNEVDDATLHLDIPIVFPQEVR